MQRYTKEFVLCKWNQTACAYEICYENGQPRMSVPTMDL